MPFLTGSCNAGFFTIGRRTENIDDEHVAHTIAHMQKSHRGESLGGIEVLPKRWKQRLQPTQQSRIRRHRDLHQYAET